MKKILLITFLLILALINTPSVYASHTQGTISSGTRPACPTPSLSVEIPQPGPNIKVQDGGAVLVFSVYVQASSSCSNFYFRLRYWSATSERWYTADETGWQSANNTTFDLEQGVTEYQVYAWVPDGEGFINGDDQIFFRMSPAVSVSDITAITAKLSWSLRMNHYTVTSCNNPNGCSTFPFYLLIGEDPQILSNRQITAGELEFHGSFKDYSSFNQTITWYITNYLAQLKPSTIYYWRIRAHHPVTPDSYFAGGSFKTLDPIPPTVTTEAPSDLTSYSAILKGTVNPNGLSGSAWFRYATTNPGTCNDTFGIKVDSPVSRNITLLTSPVTFEASTQTLTANSTYYYCAVAETLGGKGFGQIKSFTTPNFELVTFLAEKVTDTTATLVGLINPGGVDQSVSFRYSAIDPGVCNRDFGVSTVSTNIPASNSITFFTYSVTDLTPGTTYYYCAQTYNLKFGQIVSFTTTGTQPANACLGEVRLKLEPDTILYGGSVTPTAYNLTGPGCSGKTVKFTANCIPGGSGCMIDDNHLLGYRQISSCIASSTGCSGIPFIADFPPPQAGYWAEIDKNGNGQLEIDGEKYLALLKITAPPPAPSPTPSPPVPTVPSVSGSCGSGVARATDLVSTPNLTGEFPTSGVCLIDPKAAFVPFRIPTFDDLKSLYFDQK